MTYIGSPFPLELKPTYRESRDGVIVTQRWKVKSDELDTFRDTLRVAGYEPVESDPIEGTPFHIVTGDFNALAGGGSIGLETILSDVWGIAYNEEQRTIWSKPIVEAQFVTATRDQAILFKADTESFIAGNRTYTDTAGAELPLSEAVLLARAAEFGANASVITALLNSFKNSVDHYTVSLPVIRRRILLPRNTSLQPTFGNVGAIFRTSTLVAAETSMPSNLSAGISSNFPNGYWLRKAPSADQQDDGRWVYTSEYWYAETEAPDPLLYPVIL